MESGDYLITIIQASATIVAILGGFVMSRIISLSEDRLLLEREHRRLSRKFQKVLDTNRRASDVRADKANRVIQALQDKQITEFEHDTLLDEIRDQFHAAGYEYADYETEQERVKEEIEHIGDINILLLFVPIACIAFFGIAVPLALLALGIMNISVEYRAVIGGWFLINLIYTGWMVIQIYRTSAGR